MESEAEAAMLSDDENALNECRAASEPTEAQIEAATDAWQAHCGLLLLSREDARDEVLIVLRAALAAKEE